MLIRKPLFLAAIAAVALTGSLGVQAGAIGIYVMTESTCAMTTAICTMIVGNATTIYAPHGLPRITAIPGSPVGFIAGPSG